MKLHSDITNASKEEKNKEEKLQIAHMQARPMGEGRQCDARGPMALGAHEYTYM